MSICEKCGRDLYKALRERYPDDKPYWKANLNAPPEPPPPNVIITLQAMKEFRADYAELAEFAAWVCEADPKTFCRSDMMKATGAWQRIANRIAAAQEDA